MIKLTNTQEPLIITSAEPEKSLSLVPKFDQNKKMKTMAKGEERKASQREIAKNMKKNKLDAGLISQLTELTMGNIDKL